MKEIYILIYHALTSNDHVCLIALGIRVVCRRLNIWCKMEDNVEKYDILACWLYVVLDGHVLSMLWCVYGVNIR